jgi:hypothetical protein
MTGAPHLHGQPVLGDRRGIGWFPLVLETCDYTFKQEQV